MENRFWNDYIKMITKNMTEKELNGISRKFKGDDNLRKELENMKERLNLKNLVEGAYLLYHDMDEPAKCPDCGNRCRFLTFSNGYTKYCPKCGLIHSAMDTNIKNSLKTDEEKEAIRLKNSQSVKRSREEQISKVLSESKIIDVSEVKRTLNDIITNNPQSIKGIDKILLYHHPDVFAYIDNYCKTKQLLNKGEACYMLLNNLETQPLCKKCGIKKRAFRGFVRGYSDYCQDCGFIAGGENRTRD